MMKLLVCFLVTLHLAGVANADCPDVPEKKSCGAISPPASITTTCTPCDDGASPCVANPADFAALCKSKYNGVVDGGRCFFVTKTTSNWADGFCNCRNSGAEMTQIQTAAEFAVLGAFLASSKSPGFQWIAAKRSENATGDWSIVKNQTWWFSSPTNYNPRLSAEATWVRSRETNDKFAAGQLCMVIWNNYKMIGDNHCTQHIHPSVCSVNNGAQTFNRVADTCLQERAIEVHIDSSEYECAQKCSRKVWCRSFNIFDDNRCQLFTFVAAETSSKSAVPGCNHYSYKP